MVWFHVEDNAIIVHFDSSGTIDTVNERWAKIKDVSVITSIYIVDFRVFTGDLFEWLMLKMTALLPNLCTFSIYFDNLTPVDVLEIVITKYPQFTHFKFQGNMNSDQIDQILLPLSYQKTISSVVINTPHIRPPTIGLLLTRFPYLRSLHICDNIRDLKPVLFMRLANFTMRYFTIPRMTDNLVALNGRNERLQLTFIKSILTLLAIKKFRTSALDIVNKDVLLIIVRLIYQERFNEVVLCQLHENLMTENKTYKLYHDIIKID